jgi:hypothetical protein
LARNWEDSFRSFTACASDTEAEKQANAERMVKGAIDASDVLSKLDIRVFAQGSYRNNTNVRQDSDVDVCVCCNDPFFPDLSAADYTRSDASIGAPAFQYSEFKNHVQAALEKKFGKPGVTRGNKAFDVHANSYRVDADVVPAFAFRLYKKKFFNALQNSYQWSYVTPVGTRFYADDYTEVTNWPEQHYAKGVQKNERTGRKFKSAVRALKCLKYEMDAHNIAAAKPIGSYLVECLVYNVVDDIFTGDSYKQIVRDCVAACWHATKTDEACKSWWEVNEMKPLFQPTQPWTRQQAHDFTLAAWQYCDFS